MIRPATQGDLPALVSMGLRFLEASPYASSLQRNPLAMHDTAALFVGDTEKVALVSERDGELTGMILVCVFPHMLSGQRIASEFCWWVEPDARGSGLKLLQAAEDWAPAHGAEALQMVAPTPDVERLYQKSL